MTPVVAVALPPVLDDFLFLHLAVLLKQSPDSGPGGSSL